MNKNKLSLTVLIGLLMSNAAYAGGCEKTLMGSDCVANGKGVATHMRGNAVENAKASKALKEVKRKAKERAVSIGVTDKK